VPQRNSTGLFIALDRAVFVMFEGVGLCCSKHLNRAMDTDLFGHLLILISQDKSLFLLGYFNAVP